MQLTAEHASNRSPSASPDQTQFDESMASHVSHADYKIIRRNGAVVAFEPVKISIAMTKAFLAVNGGQGAASARCIIVGGDEDDDRDSSRETADERQGSGDEGPEGGGDGRDRTASADKTVLADDGDGLDEETGETGAKYPASSWCSAGISLFDGSLRPPNMLL